MTLLWIVGAAVAAFAFAGLIGLVFMLFDEVKERIHR